MWLFDLVWITLGDDGGDWSCSGAPESEVNIGVGRDAVCGALNGTESGMRSNGGGGREI